MGLRRITKQDKRDYNQYVDYHNEGENRGSGFCAAMAACCLVGATLTEGVISQGLFVLMIIFGLGILFSGIHMNDIHRDIK